MKFVLFVLVCFLNNKIGQKDYFNLSGQSEMVSSRLPTAVGWSDPV